MGGFLTSVGRWDRRAARFPVLTLTCAACVAQAIAELPQFESIVADDDHALRLIR
jgi:hypothetical protein